jgi:hypothetical protein
MESSTPQIVKLVIQSHILATLALLSSEMPREPVGTTNDGREMLQSVGVSSSRALGIIMREVIGDLGQARVNRVGECVCVCGVQRSVQTPAQ